MANSVDTFITDAANRQLKTALEELKKIHQQIIEINQQGVNFGGGGNTGSGTRSNASNLNALERERLRIANALETAQARLTLANEANTQSLARTRTELRSLNSAYLQLSQRQSESARRVQDIIARGRTATQTQRQYNQELRNAEREFSRLNQRVLQADTAVGRFNRNVGNYPRQAILGIRNLIGAFGVAGGVGLIAAITKDIFEQTKQINSLNNALKAVTDTQEQFANQQEFINRITEQYGLSLIDTQKTFTSFYASAKEKLSNNELQQVFEDIAKSSAVLGLSIEQQEGAFRALEQMLSKGTVQAEEIRGQLGERLPGAFNILAKSMGVTTEELNKLLKDGKVLADEVLPNFAKEYAKSVGADQVQRVETLVAAQNRLTSSWTKFIASIESGNGAVSSFFAFFTNGITEAIKGLTRLNTSFGDLAKNALSEGTDSGKTLFQQRLEFLAGTGSEQDIANSIRFTAERQLAVYVKELERLEKKAAAATKRLNETAAPLIGTPVFVFRGRQAAKTMSEYEEQLRLVAQTQSILNEADKVALGVTEEKKKANTELTKEQIAAQKERLKLIEEELRNQYELNRLRRESEKLSLEDLLKLENQYVKDRLGLEKLLTKEEINLATMAKNESIRLAKGNLTLQRIALEKYNEDIYKITKSSEERVLEIRKQSFNEYMEYVSKFKDEGLRVLDVGSLADDFKEKQKQDIQEVLDSLEQLKKASDEYLRSFSNSFLSEAGLGSFDKFFDQIEYKFIDENGNIQKGFRSTFESLKANAKNAREEFGIYFEAISESAQEAFNFINQLQEGQFEAQYARLEKERDVALQFAGESASAREEIERQYDERRREIQRRQAESQKQNAIFNILINTAQGIVSALASTPPNVPLSIAIGAIGAVQAGIVAAQQIPEFWKGTDNAPQGWALVDEKRPEVHTDSKGNIKSIGSEKGANYRYLNKGDKIYKSRDEYFSKELHNIMKDNGISFHNEMAKSGLLNYTPRQDKGITAAELESVIRRTQPKQSSGSYFSIKKTDVKQFWTDMLSETENKNNRYSGRGRKV